MLLEGMIQEFIKKEEDKFKLELDSLRREKEKIEHKQEKLLEAHFNDAIPLNLMKKQQQALSKQLSAINYEISARNTTFEEVKNNLSLVFDLIEDCGNTYRQANDTIKRLMNQAIFKKIWVEEDGHITTEFTDTYDKLMQTANNEIDNDKKVAHADACATYIRKLLKSCQNFFAQGLNNEFLVRLYDVARTYFSTKPQK